MSYIGNQPISAAFLTDTFSGNGTTTAFTMTVAPANTSSIIVSITGVLQDPSTYSVSGTTLTFSAAPPSGTSNISVRYLGIPASGVTTTAYRTVTDSTATAGQTTFTIPSYTVGYVDVFRNGVRLPAADYTATSGTTVVLTNAATAGDTITTVSFYVSSVLNAIPATAGSVSTSYLVDGSVTTAKLADANVTQAKLSTNVAGNGPAFSAYKSGNQSFSGSTWTKGTFTLEEYDTNSNFDTTNSRFLPTVAGYYQISCNGYLNAASDAYMQLYKNGTGLSPAFYTNAGFSFTVFHLTFSNLIYMNGSTDYLELWFYSNAASPVLSASGSHFQGILVRSA